ncbi:serine--tRNA synthetase-like protein Slimp [Ischnura elegans]|uniref:serine--tRNA synthetase-like protein Slimp n=1 Tax=Ischnura elegans TaxID=197161 RepID=UPI001ED8998A|nr:serine--tRNA synthetase-like protein Slimp [Ischnura elegans]
MALRTISSALVRTKTRRSVKIYYVTQRRYLSSALFMTGDQAKNNYAFLSPVLDFDTKFQNISQLERNVQLRGIPVNVHSLKRMWDFQEGIRMTRNKIDQRRSEITKSIKELQKSDDQVARSEVEKLMLLSQKLRHEYKVVTAALWDIEGKVVPKCLSIPNVLHDRTPDSVEEEIYRFMESTGRVQELSHIDIGSSIGVLKCIGPLCCYLKNEAVEFERKSIKFFVDRLKDENFVQFSNPDFVKSIVVEGNGLDHEDPFSTFILEADSSDVSEKNSPNRLHLVGGSSLGPFCSYFSKQIGTHPLPIKLFAHGRQYKPSPIQTKGSLLNSCQASAVQLFVGLPNCVATENAFIDRVLAFLISAYQEFGFHFRVIYQPAEKLASWESLKASFQMYSSHLQSYVEVGNVSVCGEYISKRLLMYYQVPDSSSVDFFRIVTGTVISVPEVLACVLEDPRNVVDGKLILPSNIKS